MSNNTRNSSSNSNWYATLPVKDEDEDKDEVGSLHTISDDSITTVQAIAEEAEEQQLELELEQLEKEERIKNELKLLDTHINQVSKALSTFIGKNKDELDFEDDNMTSALPVLEMKEEFRDNVVGVLVRAGVQLFMDQVSNVLVMASHPHHSGGCAHLLDDQERYCEQVGDNKATLPKATGRPKIPDRRMTTSIVEWKYYKQMEKEFDVEIHCRDECIKFIVKQYPVIMEQLKNRFDALLSVDFLLFLLFLYFSFPLF